MLPKFFRIACRCRNTRDVTRLWNEERQESQELLNQLGSIEPRRVCGTSVSKVEGLYHVMAWDQHGKRFREADYYASKKPSEEIKTVAKLLFPEES